MRARFWITLLAGLALVAGPALAHRETPYREGLRLHEGHPGAETSVGGRLYLSTAASSAISNTNTETAFSTSYTVPPSFLTAGRGLEICYQGIATSTNGTDTLLIKAKIGSTALITTAAVDVANDNIFTGCTRVAIRTDGASGTFVAMGSYADPGAAGAALKNAYKASTAIDTTASQAVTVSATWSAASASNSARLDYLQVNLY